LLADQRICFECEDDCDRQPPAECRRGVAVTFAANEVRPCEHTEGHRAGEQHVRTRSQRGFRARGSRIAALHEAQHDFLVWPDDEPDIQEHHRGQQSADNDVGI
jgi:hypothetical protein